MGRWPTAHRPSSSDVEPTSDDRGPTCCALPCVAWTRLFGGAPSLILASVCRFPLSWSCWFALFFASSPVRRSVLGHRVRNDYTTGTMIAQLTAFIGWMLAIADVIGIVFGEFAGLSVAFRRLLGIQLSMFMMTPLFVRIESGLPILGRSLVMAGQAARVVLDGTNCIKALLEATLEANRPTGRRLHPENCRSSKYPPTPACRCPRRSAHTAPQRPSWPARTADGSAKGVVAAQLRLRARSLPGTLPSTPKIPLST